MASWRFALRIVGRSLAGRHVQSLLVAGSITVAAAVVATLLCLSIDVQRKVTAQLAEFGANVAFVPAGSGATFAATDADALGERLPAGSARSSVLYERATLAGTPPRPLLVTGVDPLTFGGVLTYRLTGQPLPAAPRLADGRIAALAGGRLARRLNVSAGRASALLLSVRAQTYEVEVIGVLSTGGGEEDHLFVPLPALEAMVGLAGRRSAMLARVPGRPEEVARAAAALDSAAAASGISVKLVRRVAAAAGAALGRVRGLLAVLSIVAIAASLLSAGTVLMEQWVERRAEVGLARSMGARAADVATLALAEVGALGVAGGLLGAAVGAVAADVLERVVFGRPLSLPAIVLPATVLLAVLLAVAAVALPLRGALAIPPALALKEDRP
jgi:putative ABC transport system permease protein